jgi:hypothetical protein
MLIKLWKIRYVVILSFGIRFSSFLLSGQPEVPWSPRKGGPSHTETKFPMGVENALSRDKGLVQKKGQEWTKQVMDLSQLGTLEEPFPVAQFMGWSLGDQQEAGEED